MQVVVSQWMAQVGEYVDPYKVIVVTGADAASPGAGRVVLRGRGSVEANLSRD